MAGGLATWPDYGTFFRDRFYHVILPSDRLLIDFVCDLGLSFSARHSAARREQLAYFAGDIFERARAQVEQGGDKVRTDIEVRSVAPLSDGGMIVRTGAADHTFDRVVCTSPMSVLKELAQPSLLTIREVSGEIKYLGVICVSGDKKTAGALLCRQHSGR